VICFESQPVENIGVGPAKMSDADNHNRIVQQGPTWNHNNMASAESPHRLALEVRPFYARPARSAAYQND